MIHKRKLRDVQSAIRTQHTKPYQPNITMRNAKKDAMLESKQTDDIYKRLILLRHLNFILSIPFVKGRYTEIERENRILLEKMSNIMQKNRPSLYNPGRVEKASLNRVQRKQELMKITVEN